MTASPAPAHGLARARHDDSARRRQAVLTALNAASADGATLSVSGIARAARVHRSFLYRHPDLHAAVLAQAARPATSSTGHSGVSRDSLLADLVNLQARNTRLAQTITALERRLSEALGEAAWRASGLGAPLDVDALQRRITDLEQDTVTLRGQLADRDDEIAAARAANRDLMTRLNNRPAGRPAMGEGTRAGMIQIVPTGGGSAAGPHHLHATVCCAA